jgi:hypothetical protein
VISNTVTFFLTLATAYLPIFKTYYMRQVRLLEEWWGINDDLIELCSFIMKISKANTHIE